ncbi:MAG: hypothetical protein EOP38_01335 [Rubrivivax sp.]|nr:MAG: hypothetical protein EOP38_01335 [Rubrivivax sp.]
MGQLDDDLKAKSPKRTLQSPPASEVDSATVPGPATTALRWRVERHAGDAPAALSLHGKALA